MWGFVAVGTANGNGYVADFVRPDNIVWSQEFQGNGMGSFTGFVGNIDEIVAAGHTQADANSPQDFWLAKISSASLVWERTFDGPHKDSDLAWGVEQTSDGGYMIVGQTADTNTLFYDAWIVKTDANGEGK